MPLSYLVRLPNAAMVSRDTEVVIEDHKWHHYALTWDSADGRATLYVDGMNKWDGAVDAHSTRAADGCLVLGQVGEALLF